MAVREARTGQPPLVDEREHRVVADPLRPCLVDERYLLVLQLRERPDVLGRVDDDLLPVERGVEVRDDADAPRRADLQRLGRRAVLAATAEGTLRELLLGHRLDRRQPRPRTVTTAGRDEHPPARQRVLPKLCQLAPLSEPPSSGRKSSIGSGRMIVEERSELISSIVCRKRSWSDIGFSASTTAASFSRSEAWNSPSAAITFARRSRSASACRAIARCMPPGISTSLTSTIETLMPQGEVDSSMISCRIELILSRSESSSSSRCCPSTDRSVVWAICDVATMKFSTCTIAFFGSTIRK